MFYFTRISQKVWNKNLKTNVEITLEEKEPNTWIVYNPVKINNAFNMSAAAFDVRNKKNGEARTAIILRVQSIYGPLPAVFTVSKDGEVFFEGYSSLHGRVATLLNDDEGNKKISYWIQKIPDILDLK